jgi:hypothetical protein
MMFVVVVLALLVMVVNQQVQIGRMRQLIDAHSKQQDQLTTIFWLAVCRRYRSRAERGWIEGAGRSVGIGLIVSTAAIYPMFLWLA